MSRRRPFSVAPPRLVSIAAVSTLAVVATMLSATGAQASVGGGGTTTGSGGVVEPAAKPAATPKVTSEQTLVPTTLTSKSKVAAAAPQAEARSESTGRTSVVAELEPTQVKNFKMVGVTWDYDAALKDVSVQIRTRTHGTWSDWRELEYDGDSANDPSSPSDVADGTTGRPGTDPEWIEKGADGVAARVSATGGQPQGVRVATIDPGQDANDSQPAATADGTATASGAIAPLSQDGVADGTVDATETAATGPAYTPKPKIITRAQWGAAKATPCDSPRIGASTRGVVIHHTAGSNTYKEADSDNMIRAWQSYHMKQHGWCDIGYNFLVDRFGNIYEGRAGGMDVNVRAAHSGNNAVNTYAMGVSMMGDFQKTAPSDELKAAVVKLVGWRMGTNFLPAKGTYELGGVKLNRIAGHRDVVGTECPGAVAYAWLSAKGGLRDRVASYIGNYSTYISRLHDKLGNDVTGRAYSGETVVTGGRRAIMANGNLYRKTDGKSAYAVLKPTFATFKKLGGVGSKLGWPKSNYKTTSTGGYQDFTGGRLTYSKSSKKVAATYGSSGSKPTPAPSKTTANSVTVPSSKSLTLSGHGFGHGIGMSQYGAQNAAGKGLSAKQILAYYYPGTTLDKVSKTIRVIISADTTDAVAIKGKPGLKFRKVETGKVISLPTKASDKTIVNWRLQPSGTKTVLQYRTKTAWHTYQSTSWTGRGQFEASSGAIALVLPNGSTMAYRGALRSVAPSKSSSARDTVNVLSLEDYVRGVVASEMPSSWRNAALRTQVIAARTYAWQEMRGTGTYDICDTTACQVYRGVAAETSTTNSIVDQVKNYVLTYQGKPAFTQFSSSSGGQSAQGNAPYLKDKADKYDNWSGNPNHSWKVKVSATTLQKAYPQVGTLKSLKVTKRTGAGAWGGRVISLSLVGSKKTVTITGAEMRTTLGLKSSWFAFS